MDLVVIRTLFILVLTAACYFLRPFSLEPWAAAVIGAIAAAAVIVFELRVRALSIKRLLGAVLGSVLGIAGAALFGMVLSGSLPPGGTRALLQLFVLMLMTYVGLMVGASKGDLLNFTGGLAELFAGERPAGGKRNLKILDTSAIIDGRIADVVETGFLEGTLLVPEFVLRELQIVADSSDSSRRQRGRRGLDILQKMQAHPMLSVQIIEDDFPSCENLPDGSPLKPDARLWEGRVLQQQGNFDQAGTLFDAVLATEKTGPRFVEASLFKGQCLFELGANDPASYSLALAAFDQILKSKEGTIADRNEAAVRGAKCLEKMGRTDDAMKLYLDVLYGREAGDDAAAPAPPEFSWQIKAGWEAGRIREAQKDWRGAIEIYRRLEQIGGAHAQDFHDLINKLRRDNYIYE